MITVYTSPLIPSSVVGGKFPQADEDKLRGLAEHWTSVGQTVSTQGGDLSALSRSVAATWSGTGADTAMSQLQAVTAFATSVAAATDSISSGCDTAASYVTNTKTGINVVLIQLDNLTKQLLLAGLANPLLIPIQLVRVLELRQRARAIIAAYSDALTEALGGLTFAATISPRPTRPSATPTASATAAQPTATGSSAHAAGGSGATDFTPSATATDTTGSVAWTDGLAAYVPVAAGAAATSAIITPAPAKADTPADPAATGPQSGDPSTGPAHGAAPDLLDDKSHLADVMNGTAKPDSFTDGAAGDSGGSTNGSLTPGTQTGIADATTASLTTVPGGFPGHDHSALSTQTQQLIADSVTGKGSVQDVASTLTPSASGHSHGGGTSNPLTQNPPTSSGPTNAQAAGAHTGGTSAPIGSSTGAGSTWSGPSTGSGGTGAPTGGSAGTPPVTQFPAGTGAAGSTTSTSTPNVVAAPVAPIMPAPGSNAFVAGGPPASASLGPSIQIAPGTMSTPMSAPVPSSGAFSGLSSPAPAAPVPAAPAPVAPGAVPNAAVPPTPVASGASPTATQAGPPLSAAQPLRIDASRGGAPVGGDAGLDTGVVTLAGAIVTLGLVGAAAAHFAGLWQDLNTSSVLRPVGAVLPTQFGRDDEALAAVPLGMETVYQKVLLPGELDQLLTGQVETIRGLVYPYAAVRGLQTPAQLYDALGLGFAVTSIAGSDTLAFNRDADSVEVLRCSGLRVEDLVTPVEADVRLPAGTVPAPLVRHHRRPWTGTGEAPGSTSDNVIDEHEILGYASVGIPHLSEIWRLHADGREEYVSTYNQRNGQWLGGSTPGQQPSGRRIDNGTYATLADGTVFRTVTLTEEHSVLIAYGVSAPEYFEQVHDGSHRLVVNNTSIVTLTGVTTIGSWHGLPVQLLHRQGELLLVDYAGDDPAAAAGAGFLQTNQGQWQTRWVDHSQVSDVQELERRYPLPRPSTRADAGAYARS